VNPRETQALLPGSIGEILVAQGRLKPEQAQIVLEDQRRTGQRFGDAAVRLRLVQPEDIRRALAAQFRYPFLQSGESAVAKTVIAAYDPFTPEVEALRGIRAQIILRSLDIERREKAIAVVSARRGDGRSFLAANLAVVFAQLGERTLVIDGDLRAPSQHTLFGLENREGLSSVLAGRCPLERAVQRVPGLNLSVLTSGPVPPNPQELLLGPALLPLLNTLERDFDVVLVDTPPAETADAYTLGARIGAALLVASRNRTRLEPTRRLKESLEQSGCVMLGAVMNSAI
jgi:receptor protein-tyrosine kinase